MSRRATIHDIPSHVLERHVASRLSTENIHHLGIAGVHGLRHVATERKNIAKKRASRAVGILGAKIADAVRTAESHPDERTVFSAGGTVKISVTHQTQHGPITMMDITGTVRGASRAVGHNAIIAEVWIEHSIMTVYLGPGTSTKMKISRLLVMAALRHAANILNLQFDFKGR